MGDTLAKPVTDKHTTVFETDMMTVAACGMQGWRKKMEDAHTTEFTVAGDKRSAFVAVFDGHNGQAVAKHCSIGLLPRVLEHPKFESKDYGGAVCEAYVALDKSLRTSSIRDEGGCTAVSVLVRDGHAYCANVGDSRAIICSANGAVTALSEDHRPSLPSEVTRIEKAGGSIQHGRVNGILGLTRAMGDFEFKSEDGEHDVISCVPDVKVVPVDRATEFIVVACDGVFDVMSNEEVGDFFRRELPANGDDLGLVCELLLDRCVADVPHGLGTDNMTVAVWRPKPQYYE